MNAHGAADPSKATPLVRVAGAVCRYPSGRLGLDGLDFDVGRGETVALVGPNGSGKSTLLRLLAGVLRAVAGRLERAAGLRIGYAADTAAHFDELTGRVNAHVFARADGAPAARADALLEAFGLGPDADTPVSEYSFGMRRKLLLAEALAPDPGLLLLDEPTVGLDPDAGRTLREQLAARAAAGRTTIFATNDLDAAAFAGRIVFLHRGRAIADAPPVELLRLVQGSTRIDVGLGGPPAHPPAFTDDIAVTTTADGLTLRTDRGAAALAGICDALAAAGARILTLRVREPGLGDVFSLLTGGEALPEAPEAPDAGDARETRRAGGRARPRPPWRRT